MVARAVTVRVERAGLLTTVQDLGRPGWQRDGISPGGAMDALALRAANLLVGNADGDAGLEVTLAGPALVFDAPALVAVGGADLGARADGVRLPPWRAARLPNGARLSFDGGGAGCRAYLAVAGGVAVPPALGGRGTALRGAFGGHRGRALARGDVLPLGEPTALARRVAAALADAARPDGVAVARWGAGRALRPPYSAEPTVRLLAGAHAAALTDASRGRLFGEAFRVAPASDRMGYRLEGPPLALAAPLELLSEGVTFGTVQLPPNGQPVVLMADRQTTGGYPRLGEVATVDLPLLAQLRPGDRVRFRPVSLEAAQADYLARERDLAVARRAVALRHR